MAKWTEERRKKQAEAIRRWKPWEKSTGPKSDSGKKNASMNALKHGGTAQSTKEFKAALRHNQAFLDCVMNSLIAEEEEICKQNELFKNTVKSDR